MPLDEVLGFGLRLTAEVAIDVIQTVGAGENRMAAIVRCSVFAVLAIAIAGLTARLLMPEPSLDWLNLVGAVVLFLLGGYFFMRAGKEAVRLLHWGEPELTGDRVGLMMPGRNLSMRWDDIIAVVPETRGGRRRVRIDLSQPRRQSVHIRTAHPEVLASAILAERKQWSETR